MLKRLLITAAALLCGTVAVRAQDLIVKRDASQVKAQVLEIGTREVRYKRFSNPDGPTYVLPVEQIAYIEYKNGDRDTFSETPPAVSAEPSAPKPDAIAAQQPAALPAGAVFKTYTPGDYYEEGDVKGLVFYVTEDGRHGLLLSLTESEHYTAWSTLRDPAVEVGAKSNTDGEENMEAVARYIDANDLSWSDFPAFEWCRGLGDGWYLPAVDELLRLAHNFNGGQRMVFDRKSRSVFNETLKGHGGKRIDRMVDYYSSTEQGAERARSAHMAVEPPYVNDMPKHQKFLVRAVRKF